MRSALAAFSLAITTSALAGPLTPPGSPSPTYKTLHEVEPRTPVNAANTPGDTANVYIIASPGSYYLTEDVAGVVNLDGIRVNADDVTLDLNGFRVMGLGAAGGSTEGIVISGSNVRVHNGMVSGWDRYGINIMHTYENIAIEDITILGTPASTGLLSDALGPITIDNLRVMDCYFGVLTSNDTLSLTIRNSLAENNVGTGFLLKSDHLLIKGSTARNNGLGFSVGASSSPGSALLVECASNSNAGFGFRSTVSARFVNCVASRNTDDGFSTSAQGVTFERCEATYNAGSGISAKSYVSILESSLSRNTLWGIEVEDQSNLAGNTVTFNNLGGIYARSHNSVIGNHASYNGTGAPIGPGIETTGTGNVIDNNRILDNASYGLVIGSVVNLYMRNTLSYNNGGGAQTSIAPPNPFGTGNTDGGTIDPALTNIEP